MLPGRVIFNNANTYDGGTDGRRAGRSNIRDSQALGQPATSGCSNVWAPRLELRSRSGARRHASADAQPQPRLRLRRGAGRGRKSSSPARPGPSPSRSRAQTTSTLSAGSPTLAADIQTALNNLSTIGGSGGSVTVTRSGKIFRVIFGGTLVNADVPVMTASGTRQCQHQSHLRPDRLERDGWY